MKFAVFAQLAVIIAVVAWLVRLTQRLANQRKIRRLPTQIHLNLQSVVKTLVERRCHGFRLTDHNTSRSDIFLLSEGHRRIPSDLILTSPSLISKISLTCDNHHINALSSQVHYKAQKAEGGQSVMEFVLDSEGKRTEVDIVNGEYVFLNTSETFLRWETFSPTQQSELLRAQKILTDAASKAKAIIESAIPTKLSNATSPKKSSTVKSRTHHRTPTKTTVATPEHRQKRP